MAKAVMARGWGASICCQARVQRLPCNAGPFGSQLPGHSGALCRHTSFRCSKCGNVLEE